MVFPVLAVGVNGPKGDKRVRVTGLHVAGKGVGRDDLGRGGGRAQDYGPVKAGARKALFEVFGQARAHRLDAVVVIQLRQHFVGDLGMKGVGVNVDVHGGKFKNWRGLCQGASEAGAKMNTGGTKKPGALRPPAKSAFKLKLDRCLHRD